MGQSNGNGIREYEYDCFISYNTANWLWVEILAQNLKNFGYKVFLDKWKLVPGKSFIRGLSEGLKNSQKGILIVTQEAFNSRWVTEEFDQMMVQKQNNADFSIIPLLLGDVPDFPFIESIHCIDFRQTSREVYRKAFYYLICGLKNQTPGPVVNLDSKYNLQIPIHLKDEDSHVEINHSITHILDSLFNDPATMLLAQRDRGQGLMIRKICEEAKRRFRNNNVLHIVPPYSPRAKTKEYFGLLGKKCGFPGPITSATAFQNAFEDRLKDKLKFILIVSGFENGSDQDRDDLAGSLRNLNETHYGLSIILFGGEKLANMRGGGSLSFLDYAKIKYWPELAREDVYDIYNKMKNNKKLNNGQQLNDDIADRILEVCGGHPRLLLECFYLWEKHPEFDASYWQNELMKNIFVWHMFTPFGKSSTKARRIYELLHQKEVGLYQHHLTDTTVRRLYWNNLLKKAKGKVNDVLIWRCEAIRLAGENILGNII